MGEDCRLDDGFIIMFSRVFLNDRVCCEYGVVGVKDVEYENVRNCVGYIFKNLYI